MKSGPRLKSSIVFGSGRLRKSLSHRGGVVEIVNFTFIDRSTSLFWADLPIRIDKQAGYQPSQIHSSTAGPVGRWRTSASASAISIRRHYKCTRTC